MPSMMGNSYATNHQAWTACAYEWATAGGLNTTAYAIEALSDPKSAAAEMAADEWSWTTGDGDVPDESEIAAACEAAREELRALLDD